MVPEDVPQDLISEVVDADIVIVGAGAAGVVAAHSAAEAGAKVVLVSAARLTALVAMTLAVWDLSCWQKTASRSILLSS